MGAVLRILAARMFVFDPEDNGPASWLRRDALIAQIDEVKFVEDPNDVFSTVLNVEDEVKLRAIVEELGKRAESGLRDRNYVQASVALRGKRA